MVAILEKRGLRLLISQSVSDYRKKIYKRGGFFKKIKKITADSQRQSYILACQALATCVNLDPFYDDELYQLDHRYIQILLRKGLGGGVIPWGIH